MTRRGPSPGETLFVLSHQNHYKCLLPVIERLAESSHPVHCVIPGEAVAKNRLTPAQIARLSRSAPVSVLQKGILEAILARLWPRAFSRPRRWAGRLGRLVRRQGSRPAIVAVPLHLPNFQYVKRAVGKDTRVVCIQHDPYHSTPVGMNLGIFPVDLFCAWGEHMKRVLREHGVRQDIRITGAPHLQKSPPRAHAYAEDEPVHLLYATQPATDTPGTDSPISPEMKRRAVGDLLQSTRELRQLRLTIKLHPVDDGRVETAAVAQAPDLADRIVLAKHDPAKPIDDYIDSSDLVITILSTVAFEALVRGRPIVLFNYDNIIASAYRLFGAGRDYLSEGIALAATDGADLASALRRILYDEETRDSLRRSRERFLTKHLQYDWHEAQQRICRILTER